MCLLCVGAGEGEVRSTDKRNSFEGGVFRHCDFKDPDTQIKRRLIKRFIKTVRIYNKVKTVEPRQKHGHSLIYKDNKNRLWDTFVQTVFISRRSEFKVHSDPKTINPEEKSHKRQKNMSWSSGSSTV